jgi:hypothetical protein
MKQRRTKLDIQMDHVENLFDISGHDIVWVYFDRLDHKQYYMVPSYRLTDEEFYDDFRQN